MKRILGTFGSYFLFTTLCNKLPYSWRGNYFFEYFYLLTAAILLLLSFYFALKSLTQRLRTPPPPSHLETLFRATGFSTVFTLWALYIEIEGIQLVVDILFWFFAYFFYEVLYLRSKYPPKSPRKPHWIGILIAKRPARVILATLVFLHIYYVNWRWWEWQLKGFIGLFVLKDPNAWF